MLLKLEMGALGNRQESVAVSGSCLPQDYVNAPSLSHMVGRRHLGHLHIVQNVLLVPSVKDIMMGMKWPVCWRSWCMHHRGWEINPVIIQGPAMSVQFVRM